MKPSKKASMRDLSMVPKKARWMASMMELLKASTMALMKDH